MAVPRTTASRRPGLRRAAGVLALALACALPCQAGLAAPATGTGAAPGQGQAAARQAVPATGVTLDASELTVMAGLSDTLVAQVVPADATDALVWSSSDPAVAAVSDTGTVSALKAGSATVTATAGAASASCAVTVWQPVTSIELNRSAVMAQATQKRLLKATCLPEDATNKNVVWSSSNEAVATVDATGMVTAVAAGTATVTCTAADGAGARQTCEVTVLNNATQVARATQLATPHPYANDCTDAWSYTIPGAWALSVTFDGRTELEYTYDYAVVYDGDGLTVGYYTGTELAGATVQVPGDTVWVQLVSDEVTDGWGFAVTSVAAVPKPDEKPAAAEAQQPQAPETPATSGTGDGQDGNASGTQGPDDVQGPENPAGSDDGAAPDGNQNDDAAGSGDPSGPGDATPDDSQGGDAAEPDGAGPQNPGDGSAAGTQKPDDGQNGGSTGPETPDTPDDANQNGGSDEANGTEDEAQPWNLKVDGASVTSDYVSFTLPDAWLGKVEVTMEELTHEDDPDEPPSSYLSVHLPNEPDYELAAFALTEQGFTIYYADVPNESILANWALNTGRHMELLVVDWANVAADAAASIPADTLATLVGLSAGENFASLLESTTVYDLDDDGNPTAVPVEPDAAPAAAEDGQDAAEPAVHDADQTEPADSPDTDGAEEGDVPAAA